VIGVSLCLSFAVAFMGEVLINKLLFHSFSFEKLIRIPLTKFNNVPFALEIVVLLGGYIISFVFTYIPLAMYKGFSLADELREN